MTFAIRLSVVSSTTRAPISGATVQVTGPTLTNMPCDSACVVPGVAGTYTLDVQAPGYQAVERTVNVAGTNPACGCQSDDTQSVVIALTPMS